MRVRNGLRSAAAALLLASLAISMTFAQQVRPPGLDPKPRLPLPHPVRTALPAPTLAPPLAPPRASSNVPSSRPIWRPGKRIPLSALPPLPVRTQSNTAYFNGGQKHGRRPMAANGDTIDYFADTFFNNSCASTVGTLIPVGCDVFWQSSISSSNTDKFQDYFIDAASNTATAASGQYTGNNGNFEDTPNLSSVGTYVLAVFDVTKNAWDTVVYVSVGNVNVFGTYADSGATTPQQQFTAANGTNVYINATGLVQGQYYVAYVESTSGKTFCEYIAPPGAATPNPTGFCDPTTSPGIVAVVGAQNSAAITAVWPLSSSTPTGTYSVVLYNLTTQQRLAMRQVSIEGSAGAGTISLVPTSGNASLGTHWPTPPPAAGANTKFAFDSTSEQSDKGWSLTATGLSSNKNYTFTVTDPTGVVVQGPTTVATNASGNLTTTYTFGNGNTPGNYIGNTYTAQILNPTNGSTVASQAFQILGYNALTEFQDPGNLSISTAVVLPQGSSVTDNLLFVNNSDTVYGSGNGDTLSGFAFNTGSNGIWTSLTDAA